MPTPEHAVSSSPAVRELLPHVHEVTWHAPGEPPASLRGRHHRSYLLDFPDDVPTLVDTSMPAQADRLLAGIEQVGVEPERLLITHRHLDHVGGIDAVVDRYDPTVWYPAEEEITSRDVVATPPDHEFTHEESIGRFTAVHVPGHTPGNYAFVDEAAGVAVFGDTMVGSDRRGFRPGRLVHPPASPGDGHDVEISAGLVRLLDYEFDVALLSHGVSVFEDASAKLYRYLWDDLRYLDVEPRVTYADDAFPVPPDRTDWECGPD
ncbi:MBL fold metallo-hydrolase [Haloglomus litoreum]|uniref:MBL fold metallo-hydrolase n=1 Tax=Haloglomus litoreum TaxID=3034026 RepID=UPI0023E78AD7|nr:MBL fold metallo-hydrolase [Haloglomus sp. DT116]